MSVENLGWKMRLTNVKVTKQKSIMCTVQDLESNSKGQLINLCEQTYVALFQNPFELKKF